MKAIAAMDENRGIGIDGKIPWIIPQDFKWFKEFTMNKALVVGRTTYKGLPPLPGRQLIVLSSTLNTSDILNNILVCNCIVNDQLNIAATPLLSIVDGLKFHNNKDVVVAGGATVYMNLLQYITELYVTHVKGVYEADTYMPAFEHLFDKQEVIREFDGGHKVIRYSKTL